MTRHYQLKVTSPTTNIDVDSVDALEVARIVQLAGIASSAAAPMPAPVDQPPLVQAPTAQTCSICGSSQHTELDCPEAGHHQDVEMDMHEDVAEYDHGHALHDSHGNEVDPDIYLWQPKRAKQHFGKQADNTMDDPINESSELYARLTEAYSAFIAEDRENEAGILSPLSDPDIEDFDKDPLAGEPVVDDGSHSPMSTIKRQPLVK